MTTATPTEIRLPEMIVTSWLEGEDVQPWGGAPCFKYAVRISAAAPIRGQGEYLTHGYGSQHDFDNGRDDRAEEIAWMVLDELLSAYWDPEEFFQLAIGEPDDVTIERARGVLRVIDYAETIGRVLELNETEIREGYEGS